MFFRHEADSEKRAAVRTRGTNEAQLKELRTKARRRLIGALVLVLAAVIVVPWLFQEPVTDDTHAPAVVPATPAGLPPAPASSPNGQALADAGTSPSSGAVNPSAPAADASSAQGTVQPQQPAAPSDTQPDDQTAGATVPPPEAPALEPAPVKPAPKPPAAETRHEESASNAKPAKKPVERTDDGSVALALLAGKAPSKSAPAKSSSSQGRYYLQAASYNAEQDAQSRRDSLRQAGVTDAYVEKGQSGGRTVYRLRVGPFGSRDAALAAQARVRALGYPGGFISAN